jgi:hypothetical protein
MSVKFVGSVFGLKTVRHGINVEVAIGFLH